MPLLDGARPTAGNLASEESWRRMIGGRNRYNREPRQMAHSRRAAILLWLIESRMYVRTRLGILGTEQTV